jgi:23S rRNA (uracil1939-C5)-methyltransferase
MKDTNKTKTGGSGSDKTGKYTANTDRAGARGKTASGGVRAPGHAEQLKPGDRIVATIKAIGINGEGVGYFRRKAVFVPGALPGEVVKADVDRVERSYVTARLKEIEKRSPHRQEPPCPVYETCGGCQLQHMTYEEQLKAKEELVREAFERYAGIADLPMRPIIGTEEPWGYRNKAQLQVGYADKKPAGRQNARDGRIGTNDGESRLITGLYAPGSRRLVDLEGCPIHHPKLNRIASRVRAIAEQLGTPPYDERTRQGVLRTIVIRAAFRTEDVQLTLVIAQDRLPDRAAWVDAVRRDIPEVTGFAVNINRSSSPLVFGERTIHLWGKDRMDERLGHLKFSLSPRAFFQLNPVQTVRLYNAVLEAAALNGIERVVDAYCGTGTIALWLAPHAKEVRGVEIVREAVEDARRNAALSGIANADFYAGAAEDRLLEWVRQGYRPDVVVADPPRTGCGEKLLQAIREARPPRFVYVSCNPSTLAKDCRALLKAGYRIEWVQPVDMFPQTVHVEAVILMVHKD